MQNARVPVTRAYADRDEPGRGGPRRVARAILAFAALALVAVPHDARAATGSLRGRVADESGRPLSNSIVMVKDDATGLARWTRCEADGLWVFPALPAGAYTVSAVLGGYGVVAVPGVRVPLTGVRELDLELVATDAEEEITITVDEPLQLDRGSIGARLGSDERDALPVGLRDVASLTTSSLLLDG